MSGDDGQVGVLFVRAWVHDGQVVARLNTWVTSQDEQSSDIVVGAPALAARLEAWVATFPAASV